MIRLVLQVVLSFVAIYAALEIFVQKNLVFVFKPDWWEYITWFCTWSAAFVVIGTFFRTSKLPIVRYTCDWIFLTSAALLFKYVCAPFLYEPFRSQIIYVIYMGITAIAILLFFVMQQQSQLFSTMWGMPISTVRTASKPALHCSRTKVRCAAMLGFSLPDSTSEHSVVIRNTNMLNSYQQSTKKLFDFRANFKALMHKKVATALLLFSVVFVLVAKPSGFQQHYPLFMQALKSKVFNLEDSLPYTLTPINKGLQDINQPVLVMPVPHKADHAIVLERRGRINLHSFNADEQSPLKELLNIDDRISPELGAERGLVSAVWHPDFPQKPYIYLAYSGYKGEQDTNRLSRFTVVMSESSFTIDKNSEQILIDQIDQHNWHNGGGLQFGPDGFLYYAVGDEGGNNDAHQNSQKIDKNFFSGILRLDVNQLGGAISSPIKRQPLSGVAKTTLFLKQTPFMALRYSKSFMLSECATLTA